MKRVTQEYMMKKIFENIIRNLIISMIKSKELSFDFYSRDDEEDVEKKIAKVSERVTEILINKLKEKGLIEREPRKDVFERLVKESIEEFLKE